MSTSATPEGTVTRGTFGSSRSKELQSFGTTTCQMGKVRACGRVRSFSAGTLPPGGLFLSALQMISEHGGKRAASGYLHHLPHALASPLSGARKLLSAAQAGKSCGQLRFQCAAHALVAVTSSPCVGTRGLHTSGWANLGFPPDLSSAHATFLP